MTIFDMISVLLFIHSIHTEFRTTLKDKVVFILIVSIIVASLNEVLVDQVLIHLLSGIAALVFIIIYFVKNQEKNRSVILLLYFISVLAVLLIQLSTVFLVNSVIGEFELTFEFGMLFQSLSLLVVLLCVRFIPLSNLYIYIVSNNQSFRIIITTCFMIQYGISILWFMDMNSILEGAASFITVIIFIIIINVLLLQDGLLSRAYIEKLDVYDTYFPIIDDMVNELRQNQHDYHNHVQTILALKETGNMEEELNNYIEEIEDNGIWTKLMKIENRILAAFLYSKMKDAEKKGIRIVYHISNYEMKSCCTDYELIEMYGILLDNAIESAHKQIKTGEDLGIQVELKRKEHLNSIKVTNPENYISTNDINRFFKKGFTTKKNSKGIGLPKVKQLVKKNNGDISFYYDTVNKNVVVKISHY